MIKLKLLLLVDHVEIVSFVKAQVIGSPRIVVVQGDKFLHAEQMIYTRTFEFFN